jgi:geranylgeranyl pyrophosphate synthase
MDEDTVSAVLACLDELGAQEQAQATARQFLAAALAELDGLQLTASARRDLEETATFLVERDY